jgi:6-phosphogluconolactonase
MQYELIETETDEQFEKTGTDLLEKNIAGTLAKTGRCVIGLSGGTTPLALYRALAERPLDWTNVWVFLADERYVAPDHADSNQRAIRETLADRVGLKPEQFLAPDTWKPLDECVHLYEERLKDLLGKGAPDLVTLGIGEDGHIASLFPPVPKEAFEPTIHALATHTDKFPVADRITVTIPVLTQATLPMFFLKGRLKRRVWTEMLKSDVSPQEWPAHSLLATGRSVIVAQWAQGKDKE